MMMNHYFWPKLPLITNTDSGLADSVTISCDVYRDASTSFTNDESSMNSLNFDVLSVHERLN